MTTLPAAPQAEPLPQGVHPLDRSVPIGGELGHEESPVTPDTTTDKGGPLGRKPWATDNPEALAVFQRSALQWSANQVFLSATNGPEEMIGSQKGRSHATIWVPTLGPDGITPVSVGVIIAPTEGEAQVGNGIILNVGDSIELPTEATIWAAVIPGQATGFCQYASFMNPAGPLGVP